MKKLVSFLLVLSMLAGICLMPVQATGTTSEVYNAHSSMRMQSVTLRTQEGKEGIYYGATFKLTAEQIASTKKYGLALSTTCLDTNAKWTDGINGKGEVKVLTSAYSDMASLTPDEAFQKTSTSLINIININNDILTNKRNAETKIYVRPYLFNGTDYEYGKMVSCTLLEVLKGVDDIYTNLNDTQLKGMLGMYERFSSLMNRFELPNAKTHYYNGGHVDANRKHLLVEDAASNAYESLLLEYRREKVVANMQAQADVLWTLAGDEPVTYGRVAPSDGDKDDEANDMGYAGTFYTLYPGRIYKGLPYTHGAGGLDVLYTMSGGKPNADGVYVLQGLNRSFLNSVPKDGSDGRLNSEGEAVGQFNVARFGVDCWDAISWAYESIGADVDADQTDQLAPDYDMYPVGNYDFDAFLDTDGTLIENSLISQQINDYFQNTEDTAPIDLLYDAYAQLKPGDTLVNDTFSMMCTGIDVVYKSSDTGAYIKDAAGKYIYEGRQAGENRYDIDAENSVVHFLELHSEDDLAQSHPDEHFIYDLTAHQQQACAKKECKYCAGYDEETGIWDLATQHYSYSFQKTLQTKHFIPLRPALLNNADLKPAKVQLEDTGDTSDVTKIFEGTLASNNRISQVSLNIYQKGSLVNSTTAFGIESDLTEPYALSRLSTDSYAGAFGSVLYGTPGLLRLCNDAQYAQKLDAEGNLMTETVAAGEHLYQYTELTDADGNIVYQDGVTTADGKKVPIMVREKSKYGSDVYTIAAVDTEVPVYDILVDNTYVVEADPEVLSPGEYYFEMTCYLGNGHIYTFRNGFFTVSQTLTEAGNYTVTAK